MIANPYKSQHTGRDGGKTYLLGDERVYLEHIGTPILGTPRQGWDRLRYLKAYRATLNNRTNWTGTPGERATKDLADIAIRAELDSQQPERGVAHVGNHDGRVRVHVNQEGSAT